MTCQVYWKVRHLKSSTFELGLIMTVIIQAWEVRGHKEKVKQKRHHKRMQVSQEEQDSSDSVSNILNSSDSE